MAFSFAYRYIPADQALRLSANGSSTQKIFTGSVIDSIWCYNYDGTLSSTWTIAIGLIKSGTAYTEYMRLNNSSLDIGQLLANGTSIEIYNGTLKAIQCTAVYHDSTDNIGDWNANRWSETTQWSLMIVWVIAMLICYTLPYWIVHKMYKSISDNKDKKWEQTRE